MDFNGVLSSADGFAFELRHHMGDKLPAREAFVLSNMDEWQSRLKQERWMDTRDGGLDVHACALKTHSTCLVDVAQRHMR